MVSVQREGVSVTVSHSSDGVIHVSSSYDTGLNQTARFLKVGERFSCEIAVNRRYFNSASRSRFARIRSMIREAIHRQVAEINTTLVSLGLRGVQEVSESHGKALKNFASVPLPL